jgi:hypothetical protein
MGFGGLKEWVLPPLPPITKGGSLREMQKKSFLGTSNLSSLQALFPVYPD